MAFSIGITRITPIPTGKLPAVIGPLIFSYILQKPQQFAGYFLTFSLLLTIISIMTWNPKSQASIYQHHLISLTKATPATAISHKSFSVSSTDLPHKGATSSALFGLRNLKIKCYFCHFICNNRFQNFIFWICSVLISLF